MLARIFQDSFRDDHTTSPTAAERIYHFLTMNWRTLPGTEKPISGVPAYAGRRRHVAGGSTVIFSVFSSRFRGVLIAALAACFTHAFPGSVEAQRVTQLTHVPVFHITQPPVGWIDFCARQPDECAGPAIRLREFVITPKRWNDLAHVNKLVNATIKPLTDLAHWGVVERWSYPDDGYGDCEDYALLKRRMLIQSGWPHEALLLHCGTW
jgi:predicted transglutaminase-like cysteine proteinase